ncbi:Rieske 2Fe-2S domain-containing protein [bacterium]|nr:Rieske 2Fe-2S domain-containing protein [bacterium]
MTTQPKTIEQVKRSRLDPEPIPRRDFLGLAALWSAASTLLFATVGMLRLPKAAVLPSPSKKFRVVLPESLALHQPFIPPGRSVGLFKAETGVYAVSIVCTHLGCIVKSSASGFDCPCHGSRFSQDGSVLRGPAPKALPRLAVNRMCDHEFIVDEGEIIEASEAMA